MRLPAVLDSHEVDDTIYHTAECNRCQRNHSSCLKKRAFGSLIDGYRRSENGFINPAFNRVEHKKSIGITITK